MSSSAGQLVTRRTLSIFFASGSWAVFGSAAGVARFFPGVVDLLLFAFCFCPGEGLACVAEVDFCFALPDDIVN